MRDPLSNLNDASRRLPAARATLTRTEEALRKAKSAAIRAEKDYKAAHAAALEAFPPEG